MSNQTITELINRKSVRAYADRDISVEDKRTILACAAAAPTAGNQQLYTILDITDQKLKDELAVTCDNQPFIAKAKLVLIFLADAQKWYDGFVCAGCEPRKPGVGDLLLAVSDANIAAQNAVVAAESLGIGSCYIGDIMENCERHRELLALPEQVFPAAMLVFGYPTEQQMQRKKPERASLGHIVHENTYRRQDAAELQSMFSKELGSKDYIEWMRAFCERKFNSDFAREMSRSVGMYLDSFRSEN